MNDLIAVNYDNERPTVSGRDLHEKLEIKTRYNDWFVRMCEYGFVESTDYMAITQKRVTAQGNETTYTDHQLTIEMAKQICMIQRTDAGRRYREYFLEVERKWNSPEAIMARALQVAKQQIAAVTGQLEEANAKLDEAQPKVIFADAVSAAKSSILVGDLAKLLRQNGVAIGQKRLFEWLRNNGYLMKTGESYNMPTQKSMERGLFEIKEGTYINPDGSVRVTKTTKVSGKGQQYFINLFLAGQNE
ncbi:MAG: phage antirepressor KilAC domain-containing protein [Eubacteriales bacterium]